MTRWIVIGAGPCGLGSVARLLDAGCEVTWIDPEFGVGRMGKHYRNVPSNTTNGDLIKGLDIPRALDFRACQARRRDSGVAGVDGAMEAVTVMADLPPSACSSLGLFVDVLEEGCALLLDRREVQAVRGWATELVGEQGSWRVTVRGTDMGGEGAGAGAGAGTGVGEGAGARAEGMEGAAEGMTLEADVVLLCCGARPVLMRGLGAEETEAGTEAVLLAGADRDRAFHILNVGLGELGELGEQGERGERGEQGRGRGERGEQGRGRGLWLHNLDLAVDPVYVQALMGKSSRQLRAEAGLEVGADAEAGEVGEEGRNGETRHQTWAVVGSSHSAMLVAMNLLNAGCHRVVNIFRSGFRFMHKTDQGWLRYQGIGLKGPVGEWAKKNEGALERVRFDPQQGIAKQLLGLGVTHVVVAVGFEKDADRLQITLGGRLLNRTDLAAYDRMTGQIPPSAPQSQSQPQSQLPLLFGGGIAFPQDVVDGGGCREPWVGFKRSIEQTGLMLGVWEHTQRQ